MIIRKQQRTNGICFAWTPRWTPDGLVWLEWVHYSRTDDAYDTHPWRYARWVPDDLYDAGDRAQNKFWGGKAYETPPGDPSRFCKNYRTDGPTPCQYPHCRTEDEDGVTVRCDVDGKAFGEL